LSRVKSLDGPRVRGISPVGKEKVYEGNDLLKRQVLSSEYGVMLVLSAAVLLGDCSMPFVTENFTTVS